MLPFLYRFQFTRNDVQLNLLNYVWYVRWSSHFHQQKDCMGFSMSLWSVYFYITIIYIWQKLGLIKPLFYLGRGMKYSDFLSVGLQNEPHVLHMPGLAMSYAWRLRHCSRKKQGTAPPPLHLDTHNQLEDLTSTLKVISFRLLGYQITANIYMLLSDSGLSSCSWFYYRPGLETQPLR